MDSVVKTANEIQRLDVAAVNSAAARHLYKAREPIYPKLVHGRFRLLKWIAMSTLLAIYYLVPWLRWDRGPNAPSQAVLVDFEHQRFYFFFIELWPQEVYYITGLLILGALGLFLVTALFGRVWCGYACPQTVWTDLYIAVERLLEGDRASRIRLAKAPWSGAKILRKTAKHIVWLAIAAVTGGAWVLYFHDAPTVVRGFFAGEAPLSAYTFFGILTFTTYTLAGHLREQVCTYMCPWPRIQAALTDEEALNVTYRLDRGEPRGAYKKGQSWEGRGDCIDCAQCVAACPMGIDIRDGAQLECIGCALCIDACDDVMTKIGRPRGLIAYDNDLNIARRQRGEKPRIRLIRPRTVLYATLFAVIGLVMLFGLSTREALDVNVLRDRNPAFVHLSDGAVRNGYTVKIMNRTASARLYRVNVEGPEGLQVKPAALSGRETLDGIAIESDRLRSVKIYLTLDKVPATASIPVIFHVEDLQDKATRSTASVFLTGQEER